MSPEQADPLVRAAVKGKGTFSLGQIADQIGAPTMQVFSILEKMVTEGRLKRLTDARSGNVGQPQARSAARG